MPRRQLLSPQTRSSLFDPPSDPASIVRLYTFPPEDLALIRRRRRPANRLGFAVQLAYLRHPGRAIEAGEAPPGEMLAFIAQQLGLAPAAFPEYARRDTTRREHLLELEAMLGLRSRRARRPPTPSPPSMAPSAGTGSWRASSRRRPRPRAITTTRSWPTSSRATARPGRSRRPSSRRSRSAPTVRTTSS